MRSIRADENQENSGSYLLLRGIRIVLKEKKVPDLKESLLKEAKVFAPRYSLMPDSPSIFSCDMQHGKHPMIFLYPLHFQYPTTPTFNASDHQILAFIFHASRRSFD